jgi:hypothetical protein
MLLGTANPIPTLPPVGDAIAVEIDERTPRVARIDRSVRLEKALVAFDAETRAAERADDAERHGLTKPERIADRNDVVSDGERIRVADLARSETAGIDLEQRDIRLWIAADELRRELLTIGEIDDDLVGVLDDVMIRQHVAVARVDDNAGASRLPRHYLLRPVGRQTEETPKKGSCSSGLSILVLPTTAMLTTAVATRCTSGASVGRARLAPPRQAPARRRNRRLPTRAP